MSDDAIVRIARRPQKRLLAKAVPNGIATIAAMSVAVKEIRKLIPTMPHNVASPEVINRNVVFKISKTSLSFYPSLALSPKLRKLVNNHVKGRCRHVYHR